MDRTKQDINKEREDVNNMINQLGLTDIYRILYPPIAKYIFFLLHMNILQDRPYVRPQNKS